MAASSSQSTEIELSEPWADALARITKERHDRVIVIGGVDVGKSSFAMALLHHWARQGRTATLLDTDPGQKMVGPPGTVSLGQLDAAGALTLSGISFVGTTSAAAIAPLTQGVGQLAARAPGPLVINTSGLIRGPGVALKLRKIQSTRPDLVIRIGPPDEFAPIMARLALPIIHLPVSPAARRKTASRRAANRRAAFAAHLADATRLKLLLSKVRLEAPLTTCLTDPAARPVCAVSDRHGTDLVLGVVEEALDGAVTLIVPPCLQPIAGLRVGEMWARRTEAGWQLLDELLPAARPSGVGP